MSEPVAWLWTHRETGFKDLGFFPHLDATKWTSEPLYLVPLVSTPQTQPESLQDIKQRYIDEI